MAKSQSRTQSNIPTESEIVRAARDLIPALKSQAPEAEELRRLPDATMRLLKDAGIHKIYTPSRYGGFEMDWGTHFKVARELGQGCASTSWVSSVVIPHTWMLARFPPEAQEEFWPDHPDAIVGTGSAGGGKLQETEGGYILNGRWSFSSGIHHSDCAIVLAKDSEEVAFNSHHVLVYPSEYEILDTWFSEGLRGTGSHDVKVVDQFIPNHRAIRMTESGSASPPGSKLHDKYIYHVEMVPYFETLVTPPLIGSAMGAMAEYLEITKTRFGRMFRENVSEQIPVQVRIGESQAEIDAANMLMEDMMDRLHRMGAEGQLIVGLERTKSKRTQAYVARLCLNAVTRLSGMMGVTGQTGNNPVQRHFRDCRIITSHYGLVWDKAMSEIGKVLLGVKTDVPQIDNYLT